MARSTGAEGHVSKAANAEALADAVRRVAARRARARLSASDARRRDRGGRSARRRREDRRELGLQRRERGRQRRGGRAARSWRAAAVDRGPQATGHDGDAAAQRDPQALGDVDVVAPGPAARRGSRHARAPGRRRSAPTAAIPRAAAAGSIRTAEPNAPPAPSTSATTASAPTATAASAPSSSFQPEAEIELGSAVAIPRAIWPSRPGSWPICPLNASRSCCGIVISYHGRHSDANAASAPASARKCPLRSPFCSMALPSAVRARTITDARRIADRLGTQM